MWERQILPGVTGRQPSKIKPECASEESFLGDALSERNRDRIRMLTLSLKPCASQEIMAALNVTDYLHLSIRGRKSGKQHSALGTR
jgi:hypothetical protein